MPSSDTISQNQQTSYQSLCNTLIGRGYLRQSELDKAQNLQRVDNEDLLSLLLKLGLVAEQDMAETLANLCQLPLLTEEDYPEFRATDDEITVRFMKARRFVPLRQNEAQLEIAAVNPYDNFISQSLSLACGKAIVVKIGVARDIETTIERLYGDGRSVMGQITDGLYSDNTSVDEDDVDHLRDLASEAPVVRLVNLILQRAVASQASDIHIEPFAESK